MFFYEIPDYTKFNPRFEKNTNKPVDAVGKLRGGRASICCWSSLCRFGTFWDLNCCCCCCCCCSCMAVRCCCCRSRRFAAGTHVLFTWVEHGSPRLLQQVRHRKWGQSFFAWFPQSWQLIPSPPPLPPLRPLIMAANPDPVSSSNGAGPTRSAK